MITMSAKFEASSAEFANWKFVDRIIKQHLPKDIKSKLIFFGYEGLFSVVPEYFGITSMYRNERSYITFEFTEEQWVIFLLKWV